MKRTAGYIFLAFVVLIGLFFTYEAGGIMVNGGYFAVGISAWVMGGIFFLVVAPILCYWKIKSFEKQDKERALKQASKF